MLKNLMAPKLSGNRKRIVILGCGWAGYSLARNLNKNLYDVTVVSPRNHFLFTPLLSTTTVGTLEFRNVVESIRRVKDVSYIKASCETINSEKNEINCENDKMAENKIKVPYDKLVIACGSTSNTFGIKGAEENSYFLKQLNHARRIRNRLCELFELSSLPNVSEMKKKELLTFVIVGAGPANIEFAAELHDFLVKDAPKLYPGFERYLSIHIIEVGKTILGMFDKKLQNYTINLIKNRNIKIHYETVVKSVQKDSITLSSGKTMKTGIIIWSTGNKMIPFINNLPFKKEQRSKRLATDEFNRVLNSDGMALKNIYALGDCAINPNSPLPPTAQVAQQQSNWLVNALNKQIEPCLYSPFEYSHKGTMAYVGGHSALVDTNYIRMKGFPGWLFWNSVYFSKQFSLKNKVSVPMYWGINRAMGRNMCQF